MASDSIRIGAATAFSGKVDRSKPLSSLNAVPFAATIVTPDESEIHDVVQPLDATATYQVYVAPLGFDIATSGYTFHTASAVSPIALTAITAGQGIRLHISNSDFNANLVSCVAIAVFLKIGAADPVLTQIDILDPAKDFETIVIEAPHAAALPFTAAVLTGGTVTSSTGSRAPYGVAWDLLGPTIDGVDIEFNTEGVPVDLDNGPAYNIRTAMQPNVSFQVADNSMKNIIKANSGSFSQFTVSGVTHQVGSTGRASAMALVRGNVPMKFVMPPDNTGTSELMYCFGMVDGNSATTRMKWGKKAVPTVNFTVNGGIQDKLLRNLDTVKTKRVK